MLCVCLSNVKDCQRCMAIRSKEQPNGARPVRREHAQESESPPEQNRFDDDDGQSLTPVLYLRH